MTCSFEVVGTHYGVRVVTYTGKTWFIKTTDLYNMHDVPSGSNGLPCTGYSEADACAIAQLYVVRMDALREARLYYKRTGLVFKPEPLPLYPM